MPHHTVSQSPVSPETARLLDSGLQDDLEKATRGNAWKASYGKHLAQRDRAREEKNARAGEAERQEETERTSFFTNTLREFQSRRYTLAQFLEYVFNPANRLEYDVRWAGFFQQQPVVRRILGYWTTSAYPKTARKLVYGWAADVTRKLVRKESKGISSSGFLRSFGHRMDAAFFVGFSFKDITKRLRSSAPIMFSLFDCFGGSARQERELSDSAKARKEVVSCAHDT